MLAAGSLAPAGSSAAANDPADLARPKQRLHDTGPQSLASPGGESQRKTRPSAFDSCAEDNFLATEASSVSFGGAIIWLRDRPDTVKQTSKGRTTSFVNTPYRLLADQGVHQR